MNNVRHLRAVTGLPPEPDQIHRFAEESATRYDVLAAYLRDAEQFWWQMGATGAAVAVAAVAAAASAAAVAVAAASDLPLLPRSPHDLRETR